MRLGAVSAEDVAEGVADLAEGGVGFDGGDKGLYTVRAYAIVRSVMKVLTC